MCERESVRVCVCVCARALMRGVCGGGGGVCADVGGWGGGTRRWCGGKEGVLYPLGTFKR